MTGRLSGEWRSRRLSSSTSSTSSATSTGKGRTSSSRSRGHTAGSSSGSSQFDRLMRLLLEANILERTEIKEDRYGLGVWVPRGKGTGLAYGYRFTNPDYRRNYSKVVISSKALERRLRDLRDNVKYPVQKHLRRLLEELGAIMPEDAELLASPKATASRRRRSATRSWPSSEGERFFSVDRKTRRSLLQPHEPQARRQEVSSGSEANRSGKWTCPAATCWRSPTSAWRRGVQDAEEFLRLLRTGLLPAAGRRGRVHEGGGQGGVHPASPQRPEPPPLPAVGRDAVLPQAMEAVARYMWQQKANGKPTKDCPKPHNKLALALQTMGGEPRHLPDLRPHQAANAPSAGSPPSTTR